MDVLGNQLDEARHNEGHLLVVGRVQRIAQTQALLQVIGLGALDQLLQHSESGVDALSALVAAMLTDDRRQRVVVNCLCASNVC